MAEPVELAFSSDPNLQLLRLIDLIRDKGLKAPIIDWSFGVKAKDYNASGGGPSDESPVERAIGQNGNAVLGEPPCLGRMRIHAGQIVPLLKAWMKDAGGLGILNPEDATRIADRDGELCYNPNCGVRVSGVDADRLIEGRDTNRRCPTCYHYNYRTGQERPLDLCIKNPWTPSFAK